MKHKAESLVSLIHDLSLFIKGYLHHDYPDTILKNKLTDEIPVFCYHHIGRQEFEDCLLHLKRNGYESLTADQYEKALNDRSLVPEKSVVITFDDGLSDFYDVAYPLLKKYQFKAVVFLLPGWMDEPGILTWGQTKEMHESSEIDFQSHSMTHPAIFISPKLIDFYQPKHARSTIWNVPLVEKKNGNGKRALPPLGSPLYEYSSRFSDAKQFYPDINIQQSCIEHVVKNGNEAFFKNRHWRRELIAIVKQLRKTDSPDIRFESPGDQKAEILKEIVQSKRTIELNLSNKIVRHFAWPWNKTGLLTAKLLAENGYKTAFRGMLPGDFKNEGAHIHMVKRINGDFIKCLPGEGRQTFWSVLTYKILRRLKSGPTY